MSSTERMSDVTRKQQKQWVPGEACQQAMLRVLDTAHLSAAALWGEKPAENPNDASSRALMAAIAMIYFLMRLDVKDIHDLYFSENGLASSGRKPFPPGYLIKKGVFAEWVQ